MKASLILLLLEIGRQEVDGTSFGLLVEGSKLRALGPDSSSDSSSADQKYTGVQTTSDGGEVSALNEVSIGRNRYYMSGAAVLSIVAASFLAFFVFELVERRAQHTRRRGGSENPSTVTAYYLQQEGQHGASSDEHLAANSLGSTTSMILKLLGPKRLAATRSTPLTASSVHSTQPLTRKPLSRLIGVIERSKKSKQTNMCYRIEHFETPPSTDSESKEYVPCVISDISVDVGACSSYEGSGHISTASV